MNSKLLLLVSSGKHTSGKKNKEDNQVGDAVLMDKVRTENRQLMMSALLYPVSILGIVIDLDGLV